MGYLGRWVLANQLSKMKFGARNLTASGPPLMVAELSGNHNGSLDRALQLVDEAAAAGADAVKVQTYTADTITLDFLNDDFVIRDRSSPWFGRQLYELYAEAHTPWEWHEAIFARARDLGIPCFSTPFDETAVDFLEQFDPPAYKVASFENTHFPLVEKLIATGRPLIISTGLATKTELNELVDLLRGGLCTDFALLKCTSAYPAPFSDCNLRTMIDMREVFNCAVGLSDHTLGVAMPIAAAALGACIIEKHFTLRRSDGGPDASFSLEPKEFCNLVEQVRRAADGVGEVKYGPTFTEKPSLKFRRSIYVSQDVEKGERFSAGNLAIIRPGYGLPPKHFPRVVGQKALRDLKRGDRLTCKDVLLKDK